MSEKGIKRSQNEPKNFQKQHLPNRVEKVRKKGASWIICQATFGSQIWISMPTGANMVTKSIQK